MGYHVLLLSDVFRDFCSCAVVLNERALKQHERSEETSGGISIWAIVELCNVKIACLINAMWMLTSHKAPAYVVEMKNKVSERYVCSCRVEI